MPLSVTSAEAGLLAAPWQGASQDDVLEQAAKTFYAQTADLTQHGKHDHPTDRVVLDDTAATLALELGAEPASTRAPSISEYVKLPGSGDGFTITVHQDGHADFKRQAGGPEGATTAPGADAAIARCAGVIGHAPNQDELAGFLAARVAGGAMPGAPAAGGGAPGAAAGTPGGITAATVLSVTGQDGAVLARGTASSLLAEWQALVAANGQVTPAIVLPDPAGVRPVLLNATAGAAFLLGLQVGAGGAVAASTVAGYNGAVQHFAREDQPMLAVAAHWAALARWDAADPNRVKLDLAAEQLALRIAAEPEGARGALSATVHQGGKATVVTLHDTSTDLGGGAQFHDLDTTNLLGIVEQVVSVVADVLSFVPGVNAIAIPVAIAMSAIQGAQALAEGNILGGVLSIAGAVAGGVGAWAGGLAEAANAAGDAAVTAGDAASAAGGAAAAAGDVAGVAAADASALTASLGAEAADAAAAAAQGVVEVAQDVSRGVAAIQAVRGAVSAAEGGDGLAVLTSLAGGVAGSVGAGAGWGQALAVGSALAGAGVAAAGGDWMGALAATETAAAGAGLFGTRGGAGTGTDASDAPVAGAAGSSVAPVAQEELPPPASMAPAQADAAAGAGAALGNDAAAPGGAGDAAQRQADAAQAQQAQAQQRAGAMAAGAQAAQDTAAAGQPLPEPPMPPPGGPPPTQAALNADASVAGMGHAAAERAAGDTGGAADFAGPGAPGGDAQMLFIAPDAAPPAPIVVSTSAGQPVAGDPLKGIAVTYDLNDGAGPRTGTLLGRSDDGHGLFLEDGRYVGNGLVDSVGGRAVDAGGPPAADAPAGGVGRPGSATGGGPAPAQPLPTPPIPPDVAPTGAADSLVPAATPTPAGTGTAAPADAPAQPPSAQGKVEAEGGSVDPAASGVGAQPAAGQQAPASGQASGPPAVPAGKVAPDATAQSGTPPATPGGHGRTMGAAIGLPGLEGMYEDGTPVADAGADGSTAAGRVLGAAVEGAAKAFGNTPLGLPPNAEQGLRQVGIYPPASGGGTPMQTLNEAVMRPAAALVDLAVRAGSAAIGAYQGGVSQAGQEIGQPQLGWALAALPEAFPLEMAGGGMRPRVNGPVETAMPEASKMAAVAAAGVKTTENGAADAGATKAAAGVEAATADAAAPSTVRVAVATPTGDFYSVGYQMKLDPTSYPGDRCETPWFVIQCRWCGVGGGGDAA